MLRAIKDSFPHRPIYFSFGNYPQLLGLTDYVRRVGLVQKLEPEPVRESPDTVRTPGGFIDVKRSLALWEQYGGARQLAREGRWLDKPSDVIPLYYALVAQDLAAALEARGDSVGAARMIEQTRAIVEVLR